MKRIPPALKSLIKLFCILLCCLIAFTAYITIKQTKARNRWEKEYFNNINFTFIGKVNGGIEYEIGNEFDEELQPNRGTKFNIFYLAPIKSSISDYDPRDTSVEFYCIVKEKRFCIIESTERKNIEGGDIIKFDGIKDTTFHYKIYHKRKGNKIYVDTVLYAKWRPTDIFSVPNRPNLVIEILRKKAPF